METRPRKKPWPTRSTASWSTAPSSIAWPRFIPKTARASAAAIGAGSNARRWPGRWKKRRSVCRSEKSASSSNSAATITFSKSKVNTAAIPNRSSKPGPTSRKNCSSWKRRVCRNAGWPACDQKRSSKLSELSDRKIDNEVAAIGQAPLTFAFCPYSEQSQAYGARNKKSYGGRLRDRSVKVCYRHHRPSGEGRLADDAIGACVGIKSKHVT